MTNTERMLVFIAMPIEDKVNDPAWSQSRYRGRCRVYARSAERAALLLAQTTIPEKCLLDKSPWLNPDLVIIREGTSITGSPPVEEQVVFDVSNKELPNG